MDGSRYSQLLFPTDHLTISFSPTPRPPRLAKQPRALYNSKMQILAH